MLFKLCYILNGNYLMLDVYIMWAWTNHSFQLFMFPYMHYRVFQIWLSNNIFITCIRYAYEFYILNNKKEVWNYQTLHAYCTASIRLNLSKNNLLQLSVGSSYMLCCPLFSARRNFIFFYYYFRNSMNF